MAMAPRTGLAEASRSLDERLLPALSRGNAKLQGKLPDRAANPNRAGQKPSLANVLRYVESFPPLLDKGGPVDALPLHGGIPLIRVAGRSDSQMTQVLGEKWVDADAPTFTNRALLAAARRGNTRKVKVLVSDGADVNARDSRGRSALTKAAMNGHSGVVELLLQKGADLHARDRNGNTALMWASTGVDPRVVKLLLARGADVTVKGSCGMTPLMNAVTWGSRAVAQGARSPFMDARQVVVLEQFYGDPPANPNAALAVSWKDTYWELFETYYADLMSQTHLKDLYDKLEHTYSGEESEAWIDTTAVVAALDQAIADDPVKGKELLSEFARSRRGEGYWNENDFLSMREHFIEQDPSLGWVFDSGGLPIIDAVGMGARQWSPNYDGTDNAEAIRANPGDGHVIDGLTGDDVIYGTDRNEKLINESGDALLVAGGGNDKIWAGDGDDILDGGAGNDVLYGEAGNDTYIFRRNSGSDLVIDRDATAGNVDTIWLGGNLTPDDITLKRMGNNLVLSIIGTNDTMTVEGFFRFDSYLKRVEQIQFMDGTTWDETDMIAKAYAPTDGPDRIYGSPGDDDLSGLGGNDVLVGLGANDTLHGDEGNDRLYGNSRLYCGAPVFGMCPGCAAILAA